MMDFRILIPLAAFGLSILAATAQTGVGVGTYMDPPDELILQNHRIISETAELDGRIRVEFAADVSNQGGGTWHAQITLLDVLDDHYEIVPSTAYITFDNVEPNATVVAPVSLEVLIDAAEIVGARAALLSESILKFTGTEKFIFNTPVLFVDSDMNLSLIDSSYSELKFLLMPIVGTDTYGIQEDVETLESWVGHVLIEDDVLAARTSPLTISGPPLAELLPFRIDSVTVDEDDNMVTLLGAKMDFSYVESGTIVVDDTFDDAFDGLLEPRSLYQPLHGGTLTPGEKGYLTDFHDGTYHMGVEHAVSDRLSLSENLNVSGLTSLEGAGLNFRFKVRGGALTAASADISMSVATTLLLETLGESDNTGDNPESQLAEIATIPLPPVPINIAGVPMSATPVIRFSLGAEVDTPSALSMPLQTVTTQTIGMSWDATDGFSETNELTITPQVTSDPNVMGQGSLTASVFAQAELKVNFQFVSGLPAGAGPFVGLEVGGALALNPVNDPWWWTSGKATLYHGMQLDLLGWTIAEQRWDLAETEIGTDSAAGAAPLLPTGLDAMRSHTAPETRWLTLLHDSPTRGGLDSGDIIQQFPNGDIMALAGFDSSSTLTKIRSNGERIWTKEFDWWEVPEAAAGTPDGGVVIIGKNKFGEGFIKRVDSDGVLLWGHEYDDVAFTLTPTEVLVDSHPTTGELEYVVLGYGNIDHHDPVAIRLNASGGVMWAYYYTKGEEDSFSGGCLTSDGGILGVGTYRKSPSDLSFTGISTNLLAMKLDRDGTPVWATGIATRLGSNFFDAIETPDGSFLAVGQLDGAIAPEFRDAPTSTVARFSANGERLSQMFYCNAAQTFNLGSPWDQATGITWTPNGPVICGKSSPQTANFSALSSSWTMGLNEKLGVRWYTEFGGPSYNGFVDILDAGDGLLVLGDVNGLENSQNGGSAAIYHLPYEGMVRFGAGFPNFNSRYLKPLVVPAPGLQSDDPKDTVGLAGINVLSYPETFIQTPFTLTPLLQSNELDDQVESELRFADFMVPTVLSNFDAWADYYQLLSTERETDLDLDGDGQQLGIEFLSGGSPFAWDQNPCTGTFDGGMLGLEMPLNQDVPLSEVLAKRSFDLESWTEEGVDLELINDLEGRRVRGETPITDDDKQFIRFETDI